MDKYAAVVLSGSTREFDKKYHYLVPEAMGMSIVPGVRVIVPFGGGDKLREGYVLEVTDELPAQVKNLKDIKKAIDERPVLSRELLDLAAWMKERYICTYSDAIRCMLPAGIGIKSHRLARLTGSCEEAGHRSGGSRPCGDLDNEPNKDSKKLLDMLSVAGGEADYEELRKLSGIKSFSRRFSELEQLGLVETVETYTAAVREKYVRVAYLSMPVEEVLDDIENNRLKKIQQIRVLELLIDNEYISAADLCRFASVSTGVLDTLRKYRYIEYKDVEVRRDPIKHVHVEGTQPLQPTEEQAHALSVLNGLLDRGGFSETLLHGVTGSGKTEVYLQLIQRVLDTGRQAIVLVPEISLTPQTVERFKGRFGDEVAVLHSRLSLGERYDQWRLIREGRIKVVAGARSAIFAPLERLGAVIIDEEHENSYRSEMTPRYSAADIARRRCMENGALLVYGSATPSVETYHRAESGSVGLLKLSERANRMVMPGVLITDMRKELENGNRTVFSSRLRDEILKNLEDGQQTILFLNRRGYSSFVLCRSCGHTLKCPNCNVSMTYHSFDDRLICHYCGQTGRMPGQCPKCGSSHIRQFGTGTQKIEEDLKKTFPGSSVIRMDMDTTTGKNSHEEILRTFREKRVDILVGTQMIAKGHDFPNVTLVGVLAADSLLNLDDYRASERTFQLLTQVAGRAGRGELPGRVVIQTYDTENFSILASCRHDYESFYRQEIRLREKLGYPPFTNIATVIVSSVSDHTGSETAKKARELLYKLLDGCSGGELLLGPMRAPVTKIRNKYRWRLVIKCGSLDRLNCVLTGLSDGFGRLKGKAEVDLSVDINPVSML